ncbi:MAG TPA: serine/threonine-protein kinase [Kofleriaceae bacterium]|nr:serine/threonine-protein kinase [Kofleriaceae bacterium]
MGTPSPDDSGVVALGSVLDGRYRVEAILGKGGMGRVYKAEHTSLGRAVAIKVLHARLGGSKEAAQRFQREAMASGRLDHPNIVSVSDFGTLEDGSLFLVMEALEGEPLGNRIERDKRIPWQESLVIIRGVLAGLRHAHDKGVVHRDVKPDNIFLANKDGEPVVKILDFGIAKLYAGNADDPASTRAGLTVGTPAYLSPEQAVGGAITPASDLYSTSVVLYEMLTGRPPFLDDEPLAMLTAHVSREPPPFSEVAPDLQIPPGLEAVIQHGLAKVSAERISSANEYLGRLDEVTRAAGYDLGMMLPRSSGSLAIPAGPHAVTPSPGFLMTPAPFPAHPGNTPAAGVHVMTPPGGVHAMTPMPFSSEMGTAPTQSLDSMPQAARMVSVADIASKEPLPSKYKKIGIAMIVMAIALSIFAVVRSSDKAGATRGTTGPIPGGPPIDNETRLKAALHDLETGKTCADRKAAIPTLVDIGDERAIPSLKKARYRMRGGVIGIGDSNTNACLKQDAEMAIQAIAPQSD